MHFSELLGRVTPCIVSSPASRVGTPLNRRLHQLRGFITVRVPLCCLPVRPNANRVTAARPNVDRKFRVHDVSLQDVPRALNDPNLVHEGLCGGRDLVGNANATQFST